MIFKSPPLLTLGADFFETVRPSAFEKPILRFRNDHLANQIGLKTLTDREWINHFGLFDPLPDNLQNPVAMKYHGHQFRHYNPDIGDGRGFTFAQFFNGSPPLLELGTKGSGPTPYSRRGDGHLTLKGGVREALATQFLEILRVHTSKTFSLIETNEELLRHDEPSPTRASVLVRLSEGHIRFGNFQRLKYFEQNTNIEKLLSYCIAHFYPQITTKDPAESAYLFMKEVTRAWSLTTAQWMVGGFVHGVLNTDNMNITGESFDYGPYRFLSYYDPNFVAAYFDHEGLYSFGRQPEAVNWNLHQLASCFSHLLKPEDLKNSVQEFSKYLTENIVRLFFERLGLKCEEFESGMNIVEDFYQWLGNSKTDYQEFFHHGLYGEWDEVSFPQYNNPQFATLKLKCITLQRLKSLSYPRKVGAQPYNLLYDEIETIWKSINDADNWEPFYKKISEANQLLSSASVI